MAIDRTNYNALVDDTGSGLDGTIVTKALIASVILDPVDASLAAVATITTGLTTADTTEATARVNGDSAEATARIAADGVEIAARIAAVSAEATARSTADALLAPIASPTFTGTVTIPALASLASPTFTGTVTIPTAAAGTNSTAAASTAFVAALVTARDAVAVLTDGATPALNAALGSVFTLAAAGDRTIAVPSNPRAGQKIVIRHLASGGARTLALNTGTGGFRFGADIASLTVTASGKVDYIGAIYDATDNRWDVVAVSKGY